MAFGRKRGQDKLYKQWVSHGDLVPETRPPRERLRKERPKREAPVDIQASREEREEDVKLDREESIELSREGGNRRTPTILYILLAVSMALLCAGLVLVLKIL